MKYLVYDVTFGEYGFINTHTSTVSAYESLDKLMDEYTEIYESIYSSVQILDETSKSVIYKMSKNDFVVYTTIVEA